MRLEQTHHTQQPHVTEAQSALLKPLTLVGSGYLLLHFGVVAWLTYSFVRLLYDPIFGFSDAYGYYLASFVMFSLYCFGCFLDHAPYAITLECVRLAWLYIVAVDYVARHLCAILYTDVSFMAALTSPPSLLMFSIISLSVAFVIVYRQYLITQNVHSHAIVEQPEQPASVDQVPATCVEAGNVCDTCDDADCSCTIEDQQHYDQQPESPIAPSVATPPASPARRSNTAILEGPTATTTATTAMQSTGEEAVVTTKPTIQRAQTESIVGALRSRKRIVQVEDEAQGTVRASPRLKLQPRIDYKRLDSDGKEASTKPPTAPLRRARTSIAATKNNMPDT
jgi:hypothetical protein